MPRRVKREPISFVRLPPDQLGGYCDMCVDGLSEEEEEILSITLDPFAEYEGPIKPSDIPITQFQLCYYHEHVLFSKIVTNFIKRYYKSGERDALLWKDPPDEEELAEKAEKGTKVTIIHRNAAGEIQSCSEEDYSQPHGGD